jgi:hypothetical protein
VQYAIPTLESIGELHVDRGGGRGNTHNFSLPKYKKWVQDLHLLRMERVQDSTERVQNTTIKGAKVAPEPSLTVLNRPLEKKPEPNVSVPQNLPSREYVAEYFKQAKT